MKLPKITKQEVIQTIKKRWWVMLIEVAVLAFILVADQLSKLRAVKLYDMHGSFEVIPKLITLTYSENTGAGFGAFQGNATALSVITIVVMAGIFVYLLLAQKQTMWLRLPLIFVLGGGVGNLIDRLALGYVRDFVKFTFWQQFPVFNVADNFVTIGAFWLIIVLVVMMFKEGRKNQKEFEAEQANRGGENLVDPLDAPVNLNPMLKSENDYDFVPAEDQNALEIKKEDKDAAPKDGGEFENDK